MSEVADTLTPQVEEVRPEAEPVTDRADDVEEDGEEKFKERAKLFRFDTVSSEWKERGTGTVKLIEIKDTKKTKLLMRRDKVLKVCANHIISSDMDLKPNIASDRSWVWKVAADYTEDPPTAETLAIRLPSSEAAIKFKQIFEEARKNNPPPSQSLEVEDTKKVEQEESKDEGGGLRRDIENGEKETEAEAEHEG